VGSTKGTAREAAALEAQIREVEDAITALLKNLRPGCPPAQRVSIERMVAKKQTTLRRLRDRHLGLTRQRGDEVPGPRAEQT
jgi:hypothetical protein